MLTLIWWWVGVGVGGGGVVLINYMYYRRSTLQAFTKQYILSTSLGSNTRIYIAKLIYEIIPDSLRFIFHLCYETTLP